MATTQADFPMLTLFIPFSTTVKQKQLFTCKKAKGKVKVLPAVIFHLIPLLLTSLCKTWLDKPIINKPVFAYVKALCTSHILILRGFAKVWKVYHNISCFWKNRWVYKLESAPSPKDPFLVSKAKRIRVGISGASAA